jgi:hypothetical protein
MKSVTCMCINIVDGHSSFMQFEQILTDVNKRAVTVHSFVLFDFVIPDVSFVGFILC